MNCFANVAEWTIFHIFSEFQNISEPFYSFLKETQYTHNLLA